MATHLQDMGDGSRLVGVNIDTELGPGEATQSSSEDISTTSYTQPLSIFHSSSRACSYTTGTKEAGLVEIREVGVVEAERQAW